MRIIFITSGLEPGRDGVGDYTRRLAGELIRQGNQCRIVSLNDKCRPNAETLKPETGKGSQLSSLKSQVSSFTELQESEGTSVECLRLPGSLRWPERVELSRDWVNDFNPDWVSLQFVPFGFHPKGLCFGLADHLLPIIGGRPLHWMFHELWVLWNFPLSLRKRLLGQAQKFYLRRHLSKLQPQAVSTHLSLYQTELSKIGVAAKLLPLHGGIPVYPKGDAGKWLMERGVPLANPNGLKAGFFGNIYSTLDPLSIARLAAELKDSKKQLLLLCAGKLSGEGATLWGSLEQELRTSATFFKIGELNEQEASLYLSALNYGLTSYPPEIMGKSSVVAAMREHGLRVISCGSLKSQASANKKYSQADGTDQSWTVKQSAHLLLQQLQADKA